LEKIEPYKILLKFETTVEELKKQGVHFIPHEKKKERKEVCGERLEVNSLDRIEV